ncbi:MAG: hypothetical protein D6741_20875 [Planctomycetota bacterium]|nr:MAG: hypothetical protein D6741_20875 [Planctomycetota bacterium]
MQRKFVEQTIGFGQGLATSIGKEFSISVQVRLRHHDRARRYRHAAVRDGGGPAKASLFGNITENGNYTGKRENVPSVRIGRSAERSTNRIAQNLTVSKESRFVRTGRNETRKPPAGCETKMDSRKGRSQKREIASLRGRCVSTKPIRQDGNLA